MLAQVVEKELRRGADGSAPAPAGPDAAALGSQHAGGSRGDGVSDEQRAGEGLPGEEFKNAVAQAVYNAIVRFRGYLEETSAP